MSVKANTPPLPPALGSASPLAPKGAEVEGSFLAVHQPARSFTSWVLDTVPGNGLMLFTRHSDDLR